MRTVFTLLVFYIPHVAGSVLSAAGKGESVERATGDPYQLGIVLVYVPADDPDASADLADEAAAKVDEAVRRRLTDAFAIQLTSCFALSEDDITVSQARGSPSGV